VGEVAIGLDSLEVEEAELELRQDQGENSAQKHVGKVAVVGRDLVEGFGRTAECALLKQVAGTPALFAVVNKTPILIWTGNGCGDCDTAFCLSTYSPILTMTAAHSNILYLLLGPRSLIDFCLCSDCYRNHYIFFFCVDLGFYPY
jgi:hypothetical protein